MTLNKEYSIFGVLWHQKFVADISITYIKLFLKLLNYRENLVDINVTLSMYVYLYMLRINLQTNYDHHRIFTGVL